jgi:two-component system, LuxR family, response regulator FixJ
MLHAAPRQQLNSPEPPAIFVVDDDLSFLASISRFLRASGFKVHAFDSAETFLAEGCSKASGCLLVDLKMPGLSGLELQQQLAAEGSILSVVFLTGGADVPTSVRAMKLGAEDFLIKTAPQAELLDAVNRALARAKLGSEKQRRRAELKHLFARLSGREMQVLKEVVRGRLNKQIGEDLGINERTVKLHRTNVTRKLGVPSAAELTSLLQEARTLGAVD